MYKFLLVSGFQKEGKGRKRFLLSGLESSALGPLMSSGVFLDKQSFKGERGR